MKSTVLTDDKFHSELVLIRFVRTIESDFDLELLSTTDNEIVRIVKPSAVLLLVDLLFPFHHVHIPDVKKL